VVLLPLLVYMNLISVRIATVDDPKHVNVGI
jgi:hypothetical protein